MPTARKGACCVCCHVSTSPSSTYLTRVIGMPGKAALDEAKALFKLGKSKIEEL